MSARPDNSIWRARPDNPRLCWHDSPIRKLYIKKPLFFPFPFVLSNFAIRLNHNINYALHACNINSQIVLQLSLSSQYVFARIDYQGLAYSNLIALLLVLIYFPHWLGLEVLLTKVPVWHACSTPPEKRSACQDGALIVLLMTRPAWFLKGRAWALTVPRSGTICHPGDGVLALCPWLSPFSLKKHLLWFFFPLLTFKYEFLLKKWCEKNMWELIVDVEFSLLSKPLIGQGEVDGFTVCRLQSP